MSKIILLRHGQSAWNQRNLFTGWVDVPLSRQGVDEALQAGEKFKDFPIDVIYTSTLVRAQMTLALALLSHSSRKVPVFVHPNQKETVMQETIFSQKTIEETIYVYSAWQLNERMYGELQGLNKEDAVVMFGQAQVHAWRRGFEAMPPHGESLAMTLERVVPYFREEIEPKLQQGKNVLICAHGNSLRAIIMHIEGLTSEQIMSRELATGHPVVYEW